MRVDEGIEINKVDGRWILSVQMPSTDCCFHPEEVEKDVDVKDIVEAIRRYCPELLNDDAWKTTESKIP